MLNGQMITARCQHTDEKRQPDCWNERAHQCFHCKSLICEHHMRREYADGGLREYCVVCHESLQLSIGAKR